MANFIIEVSAEISAEVSAMSPGEITDEISAKSETESANEFTAEITDKILYYGFFDIVSRRNERLEYPRQDSLHPGIEKQVEVTNLIQA